MSRTHLIIPDPHSHPNHHNKRAEWLGALIADVKPDVVINIGDVADMPSLCSYDKGTKGFMDETIKMMSLPQLISKTDYGPWLNDIRSAFHSVLSFMEIMNKGSVGRLMHLLNSKEQ